MRDPTAGTPPQLLPGGHPATDYRHLSPADFGPEFQLLSLAARWQPGAEEVIALAKLVAAGPDWAKVVAAAPRHGVSSLILAGLQSCGAAVPPEVLSRLRQQKTLSVARALAQQREIARLVRSFSEAGIPVLVLKGMLLSQQLYGDPFLRSARDIDLMVAPEQFAPASALLMANGYRPVGRAYSERELEVYRRRIKEIEYVNATAKVHVEMHDRLFDNDNLLICDFHSLWSARHEISVGGEAALTLPRGLLPVYLCVHGALHGWQRLMWLTDFAASLRGENAVEAALAQAEKSGLRPLMLHAFALSHLWLGTAVPDALLRAAVSTRQGRALNRVLAALFSASFLRTAPPTRVDRWRRIWLLRAYTYLAKFDFRYWRGQLARDLISPTDWELLPLPERLFWLYPLIRPFGWLLRGPRRRPPDQQR